MKKSILLSVWIASVSLAAISACSRSIEVPLLVGRPLAKPGAEPAVSAISDFRGRRISEMTVVVFREGIRADEWEGVFRRTDRMSILRGEIAALRGRELTEAERGAFDAKTIEVAEILIGLYEDSTAYLLNWSAVENCRFTDEERPELVCRPQYDIYGPNPLAADNPPALEPLSAFRPEPNSRMRGNGVAIRFGRSGAASGDYAFELRLRPEREGFGRYYSGEVVVAPGSVFRRGEAATPHFRFGYAEIRFEETRSP